MKISCDCTWILVPGVQSLRGSFGVALNDDVTVGWCGNELINYFYQRLDWKNVEKKRNNQSKNSVTGTDKSTYSARVPNIACWPLEAPRLTRCRDTSPSLAAVHLPSEDAHPRSPWPLKLTFLCSFYSHAFPESNVTFRIWFFYRPGKETYLRLCWQGMNKVGNFLGSITILITATMER